MSFFQERYSYDEYWSWFLGRNWFNGTPSAMEKKGLRLYPADSEGIKEVGPDFREAAVRYLGESWSLEQRDLIESLSRISIDRNRSPYDTGPWTRVIDSSTARIPRIPRGVSPQQFREDTLNGYVFRDAVVNLVTHYYLEALYNNNFSMLVSVKGELTDCPFVLGHRWNDDQVCGPIDQHSVMVVGKHPGFEEIENGRNFIGPSGSKLQNMLLKAGFSPEEFGNWYVTNLVRHIPPDTNASTLPKDLISNCFPILQIEMRLVRPEFILLLGKEAIKAVLGNRVDLKSSAGLVFDYSFPLTARSDDLCPSSEHHCKVIACAHPAYILRSPEKEGEVIQQLDLLRKTINPEAVSTIEVRSLDYRLIDDEDKLQSWTQEMLAAGHKTFALDTEFDGFFPGDSTYPDGSPKSYLRSIQISWAPECAAFIDLVEPGGMRPLIRQEEVVRCLTQVLKGKDRRILFHYAAADLTWLVPYGLDFLLDQFEAPEDDPLPVAQGWLPGSEKTKFEGGFDVILAAHAVEETDVLDLKTLSLKHTTIGKYDQDLEAFKKQFCAAHKIKSKSLSGYGHFPTSVLFKYACSDADATFRLFQVYNGTEDKKGLLESDRFGNKCRIPFWVSMRAFPAFFEMRQNGVLIDKQLAGELRIQFEQAKETRLQTLREKIKWPLFNFQSVFDCRALLFGPELVNKLDRYGNSSYVVKKQPVPPGDPEPPDPEFLYLTPYKTSGKRPELWEKVVEQGKTKKVSPSTDRESLTILGIKSPIAWDLRDVKYVAQVCKTVLKPPRTDKDTGEALDEMGNETDDFEDMDYDSGLLSYIASDDRVHTNYSQTKETGRASSWSPATQNISKRREKDYSRLIGKDYKGPLRSIICAAPGHVLIETDYKGAELAAMAGQSGDPNMLEHVRRMQLAESDPEHYCIHSAVAITAFRLRMPDGSSVHPSKPGLQKLAQADPKWEGIRDAAKPVVFGYAYGMGAATAQRRAKEEGVNITIEAAQAMIDGLEAQYPSLPAYFAEARRRAVKNGWLVNSFGRYRRFFYSNDQKVIADHEREAQNFPIQSCVADAVSRALDNFYHHPDRKKLGYKICLQLHDAVLFEVPIRSIFPMVKEIIPYCMTQAVPIFPRRLDGEFLNLPPFRLAADSGIYLKWGKKLTEQEKTDLGINSLNL